jgi:hypothetical protein
MPQRVSLADFSVRDVLINHGFVPMKQDTFNGQWSGHFWICQLDAMTVSVTPTAFIDDDFSRWRTVLEPCGYQVTIDPDSDSSLLVSRLADEPADQTALDFDEDPEIAALLQRSKEWQWKTTPPRARAVSDWEAHWRRNGGKPIWVVGVAYGSGKNKDIDHKIVCADSENGAKRTALWFTFRRGRKLVRYCRVAKASDLLIPGCCCHVPEPL